MTSLANLDEQVGAGYSTPWVVQPGESVALHASLPHATQVDIVKFGCVNAEPQPDGRPHGPAERVAVVPGAHPVIHRPKIQPLVPGAQVQADCLGLSAWSLRCSAWLAAPPAMCCRCWMHKPVASGLNCAHPSAAAPHC